MDAFLLIFKANVSLLTQTCLIPFHHPSGRARSFNAMAIDFYVNSMP